MPSGIHIGRVLAMDSETSGLNWKSGHSGCNTSVANGYQAISWGFVVTDTEHYKPIAELYIKIKWNGESQWDMKAEKIHGMSKEYLEKHGVDEEEAVMDILEFLLEHFDVTKPIFVLGHNVGTFDLPFLKDLLFRHAVENIKFGHRCFDTFSLSMGTVKEHDSNTLFERVGLPVRTEHNALDDAKYALEVFRRLNKAWNLMLEKS